MNPLTTGEVFDIEFLNPNPSFSKTEKGPVYRVSFEIPKDVWDEFVEANTKGMILAARCRAVEPKGEPSGNSEQLEPATVKKPMTLSNECAMWCKEPKFWGWLNAHFSITYQYGDAGMVRNENKAVAFIKSHLEITSRAELDSEGKKRDSYIEHIQTPYRRHVNF